ncbi:hypothetical protein [Streptomyces sp. NRRL S-474]|uniref:hypothetical protein n=1 Tax=Streptomyces sp. NRRL S-474 TaxID=1463909 RepID=UPI0004C7B1F7|nr:hypothetical protein [Streptomyces sp. NRRL S-474]
MTSPCPRSARPPAVAVLAAVVLTLLAALGLAGPGAAGGPTADVAAAAGHHRDTGPRADDRCDTACAVRAATRHEPHSEQPAPRGQFATGCGHGTDVAPPGSERLPAPVGHIPSSGPHVPHDRGRAPPELSGT